MTGLPPDMKLPKLLTLTKPMLADYLFIAHHLPEDQRRMFEVLGGFERYDEDAVSLSLAGRAGPKWCAVQHDGTPVGIGGLTPVADGIWQDFLITTDECWKHYAKAMTRYCRDIANKLLDEGAARRVQTITLESNSRVRAWYEVVGMRYEGTLRSYGRNGENAVMYSMLRGDNDSK